MGGPTTVRKVFLRNLDTVPFVVVLVHIPRGKECAFRMGFLFRLQISSFDGRFDLGRRVIVDLYLERPVYFRLRLSLPTKQEYCQRSAHSSQS